jgi:WD40 repeat protein
VPVQPGQTLLHYRLVEKIGEGGMGVVWAAVDCSLDRPAAIKLLPELFAEDTERLARLEREAKLLASLNHPGIASVYGLHEAGPSAEIEHGVRFLAMEKVDGPTLHERLREGRLSVDDAIDIGRQIADAVAAAHQSGVLHRDLKPANIKITPEGKVKVLDFGLAKAVDSGGASKSGSGISASLSPTVTSDGTMAGVILGTVAYMSPEQARGRAVDRRTDVWSFGCVLYELLTGRTAFGGETVSDTVAHLLRGEPDWAALPSNCPAGLVHLLRRCLRKDADQRLHDLADARVILDEVRAELESGAGEAAVGPVAAPRARVYVWATIALVVGGLLGTWVTNFTLRPPSPSRPAHLSLFLPEDAPYHAGLDELDFHISPSGEQVIYLASPPSGPVQVSIRALGRSEAEQLAGTEDANGLFLSPDASRIGFIANGRLKHVPISGGNVATITDAAAGNPTWGADGYIYYSPAITGGLYRVAESGGEPEAVTKFDPQTGEFAHWHPELLPGGRFLLYSRWSKTVNDCAIGRYDLLTGEDELLLDNGCCPRYAASGHLLFSRGSSVMAARIDPKGGRLTGSPVVVLDDVFVGPDSGYLALDVAENGTLVYVPESRVGSRSMLTSVDLNGNVTPLNREYGDYYTVTVSPDGDHLAVALRDGSATDIWIYDYERDGLRRSTFDGTNRAPVWAADGRRVTFQSIRHGPYDIYWKPLDESEEESPVFVSPHDDTPSSWSGDGRRLLFVRSGEGNDRDIWLYSDGNEEELIATPFREMWSTWSPDGRWIAFQSNESGRYEVYVVSYPLGHGRWQISLEGGTEPRWALDGRTLYFLRDDALWAAEIDASTGFRAGRPRRLFGKEQIGGAISGYDVHPDGKSFIILRAARDRSTPMEIVVNWFAELERLVPATD